MYDFCIQRPRLTRTFARLVWGTDVGPMYGSFDSLAELPEGATILDVPCGGGVALRGLRAGQSCRYIGCDISPQMLGRARRRAAGRRGGGVELVLADMRCLPFEDRIADVCLCFNGLSLVSEPERVVGELARCLRPGGTMLGCTMVSAGSRRQRTILALQKRRGQLVPDGSLADLKGWLGGSGLTDISLASERGLVVFSARKEPAP